MFKVALSYGVKRNKLSSNLLGSSKICGIKKLYCTRQRKNGSPTESCLKCKSIIKYIYGNHAPPTCATETKHKNRPIIAKCPKCNRTIMFTRENLYNYDLTRQSVVNGVRSQAVKINANKTRSTKIKELNEKIGENVMQKNIFEARKNSSSDNSGEDKIKVTTKQQNSKQYITQNYAIVKSDGDGPKMYGDNLINVKPKANIDTEPIIKNDTPNEKSHNIIVKNKHPSAVTSNSLSYGLGNNNDQFKTGSTEYQQLDISNNEVKDSKVPKVFTIGHASHEKMTDKVFDTKAQVPEANLHDESLWKLSNKESTSIERNRKINETISNSDEAIIVNADLCLPFHVTSLVSYTNDYSYKSERDESTEMNPNEAFSPQINQKIFYTVENKTTDREDTNVIYKLEYPNAVTNNCLSYGLPHVDGELETSISTANKPVKISSNEVKESKAPEINFINPTTPKTVTQRVMVTRAQVSKANNFDEESLRRLKKNNSKSRPMKVSQTHRHNKVALKTPDGSKSKITNLTSIDRSKSLCKTTPNVISKTFGYTYSKGDKIRTKNNKIERIRHIDNDIDGNSYVTYLKTKSGKSQSISKPKGTYEVVKSKPCNLENDQTKNYEVFLPDVVKKVDSNVKSKKSDLPGLPVRHEKWDKTVKEKELEKISTNIFSNPKSSQTKSKEIGKAFSNISKPIQDKLPTIKSKEEEFIKFRQFVEMLRSKNKDVTQIEDINSSKEFKNITSTNSQSNKLLSDTKAIKMKPNREESSSEKLDVRSKPLPTSKTIENRLDHLIKEKYTIELPKDGSKVNLNFDKYWSKNFAKQKTRKSKAKDVKTKTSLVLFKPHTQKYHPINSKPRLSSLDNISKYSNKRRKKCKKARIDDAELQTMSSEIKSENKNLLVSRHEAENKYTKEIVFKDKTSPLSITPRQYLRARNKQLMKSKMQTKSKDSEMENKIGNYLVINQRAGSDSYKSPATKENYPNINQSAQNDPIKRPDIIGKDTSLPNFVYKNTLEKKTSTPVTTFIEKVRPLDANNQNLTSSEKESTGENVTNINQSLIVAEKERMNEEFSSMNKSVQGTVYKSPAFEEGEFYGSISPNIQTFPSTPTIKEQKTDDNFSKMNQSVHSNLYKCSNTIEYESKSDDFAIMNQSLHSNLFQNTPTIGIETSTTKKENVNDSKIKKDVEDSTHRKPLKMSPSEKLIEVKEAYLSKIMSPVHFQEHGKDISRNNRSVVRHENLHIKSHSKPERSSKSEEGGRSKENITIDERIQRDIIKNQASAALATLEQDSITILNRDTSSEKKSLEQSSKSKSPQMPYELSKMLPLSELLKQARKISKQKAFEIYKVTRDSKMEGTVSSNLTKYDCKSESALPNEKISEVGPHASANVLATSSTIGKNEKLEANKTPESEISLNALRKNIQARNLMDVFKNIDDNKLETESKVYSSSGKARNKFEKPGQPETTLDAVVNTEKPKAWPKTLYRKPSSASQDRQNDLKQKNTECAPMPKPNEYTVTISSTLGQTKVRQINVVPREVLKSDTTTSNPLRDPQFHIASTSNTSKEPSSDELKTDSTPYVSTQKSNAIDSKDNKDMISLYQSKTEKSIERSELEPTIENPIKSTEPKSVDQLTGSGAIMPYAKRGTPKHHKRKNCRQRIKPLHHHNSCYRPVIGISSDSKNSSRYSKKPNPSDKKDS